ncbi:MAG: Rieske (2Fe-2S) protein [Planctomycetota bacterium]|nr:Rieske (2Fe-2S) protein [Planctomycetota bacterium]MDA1137994.1 Rieske (2Fe-2S) protein [Planctomycetota bacterium]
MSSNGQEWIKVGTVDQLKEKGVVVVHGDRPIAVFEHEGKVSAIDNRCPHMGFPMHKGTVKDGIITCHWHQAKFDLCSGCTFDLFADDIPTFETKKEGNEIHVKSLPAQHPSKDYYFRRLHKGMEQNIGVILAKSIGSLLHAGATPLEVVKEIALYGSRNSNSWGVGMTSLTVVANLLPHLDEDTAYYALFRAVRSVASDTSGSAPRRLSEPLANGNHDLETLKRWFRQWIQSRHRSGAERVALTALQRGLSKEELTDFYFSGLNDRVYADTGHVFDFNNKAFELIDLIGDEHAMEFIPLVVPGATGSRGVEEDASWHHPIGIIGPLRAAEGKIAQWVKEGEGKDWADDGSLRETLLGDDPLKVIEGLGGALSAGACPVELAKQVSYAAAIRLARFAKSNEVSDWFAPQHTFIYSNAVFQAVKRSQSPEVLRGIFHGALSVYMNRFLNIPAAKLPSEISGLDSLSVDGDELREQLLDDLNHRAEIDSTAKIVARYISLGHPIRPLINSIAYATVREDVDFHYLQVLEAGVHQYHEWEGQPEAGHIMVGVMRNLAAASPTRRAGLQVADIALRLNRGENLYEEE